MDWAELVVFYFTALLYLCTVHAAVQNDYCIIGAGPAGLQMGYFLQQNKRNYMIFEKTDIPGSFFVKYPIHRKLISINKRFTGKTNAEFNLRHDWNSLISHDPELLFTKYSKEYFPHADDYLRYISDFATKLKLKIQYDTTIGNITVHPDRSTKDWCRFSMNDQKANSYCCRTLIVATGIAKPNNPKTVGAEYITGYEDLSTNPDDFAGQSILIIGRGNAGLETAQAVYGSAAYIHLVARGRIRFSWETHYVGDIRGVNNEIFDSYMLKSLDGIFEASMDEMGIKKREQDGKLVLHSRQFESLDTSDKNPIRDGYDRIIRCLGFLWDPTIFNKTNKVRNTPTHHKLEGGRHKKFPHIRNDYESAQYPGMYFAGPLAHSLDFRKAAGGFIHGFRYSARALSHMLEWRMEGVPWPSVTKSWGQIVPTFMKRANEGSGIYQMFQTLGDVAIVHKASQTFTYLEEFPINLLPNLTEKTGHKFNETENSVFVLVMEYGANFSKPGEDHFGPGRVKANVGHEYLSNFLHPVIYFYRSLPTEKAYVSRLYWETLPKPDGIVHIIEDFTTNFDGPTDHILPARKFFEFFLEHDLRTHLADDCITMALGSHLPNGVVDLPASCQQYLMTDESAFLFG